ncbi:hypothetical protein LguiA_014599 [Lonicera macranthoides]
MKVDTCCFVIRDPMTASNFAPIKNGLVIKENQEGLIEWLEEQVYWKRNKGLDRVFICQDPNALYKVIDRVKNGVLLGGSRELKLGNRCSLWGIGIKRSEDVVIKHGAQPRESRRMASQGMHSSKFCLHPTGDTPSACRLFDAILSLCVPVIISGHIELPFEDVIDYRKIAVFIDSNSAVKPGT